jgi:hypothetical protein
MKENRSYYADVSYQFKESLAYFWKAVLPILSHFQKNSTMSYVLSQMSPSRTLAFSYLIPILLLSLYPHWGRPIYFLHWRFKTKDLVFFTCFKTSPPVWSEHTSSCLQQPELGSEDILGFISTFSAYSCFTDYASHTELCESHWTMRVTLNYASHTELFLKSTVLYVMTAHHVYSKQQHTVPLEKENSCFAPAKFRPFVIIVGIVCRWRWVEQWWNGTDGGK